MNPGPASYNAGAIRPKFVFLYATKAKTKNIIIRISLLNGWKEGSLAQCCVIVALVIIRKEFSASISSSPSIFTIAITY